MTKTILTVFFWDTVYTASLCSTANS